MSNTKEIQVKIKKKCYVLFFVFPDNLTLGSKRAVTSFYITNADWTHLCIDNILKKKDLLPIIATSTISTKKQNKNTKKTTTST